LHVTILKDEEIHQHTHMMEQLTLRLSEKEETLEQAEEEKQQLQAHISTIEQELSKTHDEVITCYQCNISMCCIVGYYEGKG